MGEKEQKALEPIIEMTLDAIKLASVNGTFHNPSELCRKFHVQLDMYLRAGGNVSEIAEQYNAATNGQYQINPGLFPTRQAQGNYSRQRFSALLED